MSAFRIHSCHACFFSFFFVIGICVFLFGGCNTNIESQCASYDIVKGVAYGQKFTSKTCRKCILYVKGSCRKYRHYECYSSFVKFHYGSNETCLYNTARDEQSKNASMDSVNSHPIGDVMTLLKKKDSSSHECYDVSEGMKFWIIGVCLLSFCVVIVLLWICSTFLYMELEKYRVEHFAVPTIEIN